MKAKKIFKGMTAAAIAAVLAASVVPMTAFAADPNIPDLTINAVADSTDATVKVYKVFNATTPEGTSDTVYRYTWATGFSAVTVGATTYDVDDIAGLTSNTDTVKSVAAALARQAASATPINDGNTSLGTTGLTLEDVGAGYYLIVYSTGDTNKIIDPVLVSITDTDATQSAKVADLTVEKKITEVDGGTTYVSGTGETGAVGNGSTVKYQITTQIPKYDAGVTADALAITGIDDAGFVITDTPGAGITLDTSGVAVSYTDLDDTTTDDYTVTKEGNNIVIKFTKAATIENAGQAVTVDITANITADIDSSTANKNDAKIEFANDYSTGKGYGSDNDDANVYSTKLTVDKIDGTTSEKLNGAEFKLTPNKGTPGSERIGATENGGVLVFEDLAPGTYTLTETQAPDAKYTLAAPVEITIDATTTGEFAVTSFSHTGTGVTSADGVGTVQVKNYAGQTLPATGGIGTTIFTIAGVGVVLVAGAMLVVYMRKRRTEDEE